MIYTVRPISDRTWLREKREFHRFDSTWTSTLGLLSKEIAHLKGRDVVIECDVEEKHIRNDGMLRSNAKPTSPAVVVAFESKHGPMLYRSDRYRGWSDNSPGWQANVRAVALTLQALRAVDRYGATETGQQYAGFKALPAGRAMPASHMTAEYALQVVHELTGFRLEGDPTSDVVRHAYKHARAAVHPDRRAGDQSAWDAVTEAGRVLGVAQ